MPLHHLYSNAHGREESTVISHATHPAPIQIKDVGHETLHRFDRRGAFFVIPLVLLALDRLDHLLTSWRLIHPFSWGRDQLNVMVLLQRDIQMLIVRLAIHAHRRNSARVADHLGFHPLGFVAGIGHPLKDTHYGDPMGGEAKGAMAIDPAIGLGLAPGSLFVEASSSFGDKALLFLLLVPDGAFRFDHHLVGTDFLHGRFLEEIFEK
jgi:hypothetical protein